VRISSQTSDTAARSHCEPEFMTHNCWVQHCQWRLLCCCVDKMYNKRLLVSVVLFCWLVICRAQSGRGKQNIDTVVTRPEMRYRDWLKSHHVARNKTK